MDGQQRRATYITATTVKYADELLRKFFKNVVLVAAAGTSRRDRKLFCRRLSPAYPGGRATVRLPDA